MTFVVPFDGSTHANSALARASEIGRDLDEDLRTVTVVPGRNTSYARERGWLDAGDPFDLETIVSAVTGQVHQIAPEATVDYENCSRDPTGNRISKPIRKYAKRHGASMVFIGSDNAGRLVTSLQCGRSDQYRRRVRRGDRQNAVRRAVSVGPRTQRDGD